MTKRPLSMLEPRECSIIRLTGPTEHIDESQNWQKLEEVWGSNLRTISYQPTESAPWESPDVNTFFATLNSAEVLIWTEQLDEHATALSCMGLEHGVAIFLAFNGQKTQSNTLIARLRHAGVVLLSQNEVLCEAEL